MKPPATPALELGETVIGLKEEEERMKRDAVTLEMETNQGTETRH